MNMVVYKIFNKEIRKSKLFNKGLENPFVEGVSMSARTLFDEGFQCNIADKNGYFTMISSYEEFENYHKDFYGLVWFKMLDVDSYEFVDVQKELATMEGAYND